LRNFDDLVRDSATKKAQHTKTLEYKVANLQKQKLTPAFEQHDFLLFFNSYDLNIITLQNFR